MGFDDLAKHMAARDRRALSKAGNASEIMAEAASAERRMNRTRDLILGPIMLAGGLLYFVLVITLFVHAATPNPNRPPSGTVYVWLPTPAAIYAIGYGIVRTIRGLRGRSA